MRYRSIYIILFLLYTLNIVSQKTVQLDIDGMNFNGDFFIYFTEKDPKMAMRPSEIENVQYNVITWQDSKSKKNIGHVKRKDEQTGDGFDDSILEGDLEKRTADLFDLSCIEAVSPYRIDRLTENKYRFVYKENEKWNFYAEVDFDSGKHPLLTYKLSPKVEGFFSVLYSGAPKFEYDAVDDLLQPMIWQERRIPDMSYVTSAFQCPVPATFLTSAGRTVSVVVEPEEFDFNPLPVLENSRFGVALRTSEGKLSPMVVSPILGGCGSYMRPGDDFEFKSRLLVLDMNISSAFEYVVREIYGFNDYRKNDIATLNENIENTINYALSEYSWFIDEQKGCAYSTDVPGAVKNVSSLDPLEIAIVTDNKEMFDKRAYPILEYQLSREKFLFCADSTQKVQSPSRKMNGPIAPVSELTSLYTVFNNSMPFLLDMSKAMYKVDKVRNLEVLERGDTWQNALWIYRATNDKSWLDKAIEGADEYIKNRINKPATDFSDSDSGGFFFWTGYTPRWIDLLELYEETGLERFLNAAHDGARRYTNFIWFAPKIPNDSVLVNKDGKAPLYWYLAQKGHEQMYCEEELAPAWRLSEIGLTPESSGTCSGHRAIFMVNYAPWFLRIAGYTGDKFLAEVAKSAMVGRSRNFPGYHINTERTTIYEKTDYPLRNHKELSVNSFHYNHIMPKITSMIDYLVTDAWYRSDGNINFPNTFIEGYAYLQTKFYGFKPGSFYGEKAWLWMPENLILNNHVELNYISARNENKLMLSFCNQSDIFIRQEISLNPSLVKWKSKKLPVIVYTGNVQSESYMIDGNINLEVPANGVVSVIIDRVIPNVKVQDDICTLVDSWSNDYYQSSDDVVRAMVINVGSIINNVYLYITKDDNVYNKVFFEYEGKKYSDSSYPYEFTIPLSGKKNFEVNVKAVDKRGIVVDLGNVLLNK